ncbi:MAG TPA: hypothetical protein VGP44_09795 [Gemmatimonadales bacterium]|nr:hypothetical protein [Gemmatimonadales bacterium]
MTVTRGTEKPIKQFMLASDFDQTLSLNDSGLVLSEMLGISGFAEKAAGLSNVHLVQQGAELAYLLLHDPEYRRVRREDLVEVGRRVRLKQNLALLPRLLERLRRKSSDPRSKASSRRVTSSAPASAAMRRPGRSGRSCRCRQDTARWPGWRSCVRVWG